MYPSKIVLAVALAVALLPACTEGGDNCEPTILAAPMATSCPSRVTLNGLTYDVTCMVVHRSWLGRDILDETAAFEYRGARKLKGADVRDAFALVAEDRGCGSGPREIAVRTRFSGERARAMRGPRPGAMRPGAVRTFGFGRLPVGSVELCPHAESELKKTRTRGVMHKILKASSARQSDTRTIWKLLDRNLQQAFGSRGEFGRRLRATPRDRRYAFWNAVERSQSLNLLPLRRFCPQLDLNHVLRLDVYFPKVRGVSGGAAQLFFVGTKEGPRLWFVY